MVSLALDSWAVMAWLKGQQPAAEKVRLLLDAGERGQRKLIMNVVNLGEVFYLSMKARDVAFGERVLASLRARITTVQAPDEIVMAAAKLKSRYAISYADAFAAATALLRDVPLVTGAPEFKAMTTGEKALKLEWIGA